MDTAKFPNLARQQREEAFWRTLIWNADQEDQYPAPDVFGRLFIRLLKEKNILVTNPADYNLDNHQRVIPHGEQSLYYDAFLKHGFR
jgi:hypothetical protein